jgi:putative thioredoxin
MRISHHRRGDAGNNSHHRRAERRALSHRRVHAAPGGYRFLGRLVRSLQDPHADPREARLEYAGAFLLAKVNADEQQMIAQQFGVRSLPTVMIMQNGQPVDGFAGAQPEAAMREMLEKYLPSPFELPLPRRSRSWRRGCGSSRVDTARCLRGQRPSPRHRHDVHHRADRGAAPRRGAGAAGRRAPLDQDALYEQALAQLSLAREAAQSPELLALEEQLASDPDNLDLREQLAVQYSAAGQSPRGP